MRGRLVLIKTVLHGPEVRICQHVIDAILLVRDSCQWRRCSATTPKKGSFLFWKFLKLGLLSDSFLMWYQRRKQLVVELLVWQIAVISSRKDSDFAFPRKEIGIAVKLFIAEATRYLILLVLCNIVCGKVNHNLYRRDIYFFPLETQ